MKQFLLMLSLCSSLHSCVFDDGFTPSERRRIAQASRSKEYDMFEHFRPLGKYLLVRIKPLEEKTSGGIFMAPQAKKEEQRVAIVIAIGEEVTKVDVGDTIYMGQVLVKANEEYYILVEDGVLGVIE